MGHPKAGGDIFTESVSVDEGMAKDASLLRDTLPSFRCRLNQIRSPLLRLPPEMLVSILHAAADENFPGEWLPLGHICHDLRAALLGMHILWADIVFDFSTASMQDELLERAGPHLITINLDAEVTLALARRAVELLPRARKFTFTGCDDEDVATHIMEALKQCSYPNLEYLRIDIDPIVAISHRHSSSSSPHLDLVAPTLRVLHLTNVLTHMRLFSLRELSLTWEERIPDVHTFFVMLRQCTLLERLSLIGIPERRELERAHQEGGEIQFPRLSRLELGRARTELILKLWDILVVPTSTAVELSPLGLQNSVAFIRSLGTFVRQTQTNHISKISRLSVRSNPNGPLSITLDAINNRPSTLDRESAQCASTRTLRQWDPAQSFVFKLNIPISRHITADRVTSALECLCRTFALPFEVIDTVHFRWPKGAWFYGDDIECRVLHNLFPSITTLELDSTEPYEVAVNHVLGSAASGGLKYFPRLQELYIDEVAFTSANMNSLVKSLQQRADHGQRLHVLTLTGRLTEANTSEEVKTLYLKRLQALVPHVCYNVAVMGRVAL